MIAATPTTAGWIRASRFRSRITMIEEHVQFRSLRVMNDDRVAGGGGFPPHPHRDMEIVTYVLEGALEHQDSMGNGSVIKPGDVQYMSAGTGVTHSEFNASKSEPVHLYQIWMMPDKRGHKPAYDQKTFSDAEKRGKLRLVASPDGREGSVKIRQDNELYATVLGAGESGEARSEARTPRLRASRPRQRHAQRQTARNRRRRRHLRRKIRRTHRNRQRRSPPLRPGVIVTTKATRQECRKGASQKHAMPLSI